LLVHLQGGGYSQGGVQSATGVNVKAQVAGPSNAQRVTPTAVGPYSGHLREARLRHFGGRVQCLTPPTPTTTEETPVAEGPVPVLAEINRLAPRAWRNRRPRRHTSQGPAHKVRLPHISSPFLRLQRLQYPVSYSGAPKIAHKVHLEPHSGWKGGQIWGLELCDSSTLYTDYIECTHIGLCITMHTPHIPTPALLGSAAHPPPPLTRVLVLEQPAAASCRCSALHTKEAQCC
jgi:hypothetical protein